MKYKIIDAQNNVYLANEFEFDNLKKVCEYLIGYHSIDTDMTEEKKLFDEGRYDECWNELAMYDWELEEVEELSECEKWILDKEGEEALARYQGRI